MLNLNGKYRLNPRIHVALNNEHNQAALFNMDQEHWFKISLDALKSVGELSDLTVQEFFDMHGREEDFEKEGFTKLVEFMAEKEYLVPSNGNGTASADTCERFNRRSVVDVNAIAKRVWLSVTSRCNLKCIHCYNSTKSDKNKEAANNEDKMFEVLERLENENIGHITVSGGEPFLRKDIFQILTKCKELAQKVSITTNGMLIQEQDYDKLRSLNPISVSVSIDGIEKTTHERFRGKNTFDKAISTVKRLKSFGIDTNICATITKVNYRELVNLKKFAEDMGVTSSLSLYTPVGRGELLKDDLMLSCDTIDDFAKILAESVLDQEQLKNAKPAVQEPALKRNCSAGVGVVGIEHTGRVVPCHLFFGKDVTLGNLLEESLDQMQTRWLETGLPTVDDTEACRACAVKYFCANGCLAHRFQATGSLQGKDPYCGLYTRQFEQTLWHL